MLPGLRALTARVGVLRAACSTGPGPGPGSGSGSGRRLMVEHDRHNRRFTVAPGSGAGAHEFAVLTYRFTGEKEVDLMSTYVPEIFRGQGVAALLSQAALDFLVEENLKARVSCWYIKKFVEDHPLKHLKDLIIS